MKKDIQTRKDIHQIISDFYKKLKADPCMYSFFEKIFENNLLEHHLNTVVDFWEDVLFQTHKYLNNPMQKHLDFHQKMNFKKHHFDVWLKYLHKTIDISFKGNYAENMKTRAASISMVMQVKMNLYAS